MENDIKTEKTNQNENSLDSGEKPVNKLTPNKKVTPNKKEKQLKEIEKKQAAVEKEIEKKDAEELLKSRMIVVGHIELPPEELGVHPIYQELYGDVEPDPKIIKSLLDFGPIKRPYVVESQDVAIQDHFEQNIQPNPKYLVISEIPFLVAMLKINAEKMVSNARDKKDSADYVPTALVEIVAPCTIVRFATYEDLVKTTVELNKPYSKLYSHVYNEIKRLHGIYDYEALQRMKIFLKQNKQNTALLNLKKRLDIDIEKEYPGMSESEIIDELYKTGRITEKDIIEGEKESSDKKLDTMEQIATDLDRPRSECCKIDDIGKLGEEDSIGQEIMRFLDDKSLALDNGHKVFRLRNCQLKKSSDKQYCAKIQEQIDSVLKFSKKTKSGKIIRNSLDANKVKTFEAAIKIENEAKKVKTKSKKKYNVILAQPEKDNFKDFNWKSLQANDSSVLLILADDTTYFECMNLLSRLSYINDNTYYMYGDSLLFLGTRNNYPSPSLRKVVIPKDSDLYAFIRSLYPEERHFHEILNKRTPDNTPYMWEVPIGADTTPVKSSVQKRYACSDPSDPLEFESIRLTSTESEISTD